MTYIDEINHQINSVQVAGGARIHADADHGRLVVNAIEADNLAISFDAFAFESPKLAAAKTSDLTKIADKLSQKITYLLEPIRVVEIDGDAGAVQLRSYPPYKKAEQTTYYEVLVQRGGSISLVRYQKTPGQARSPIAAYVTLEVFHRLAEDFAAAV